MTEPSQYFKGRTVQEQMNEVIGYVDVRSAEVATTAIAADVAQVHQDMLDADADASAAAASAAAAAGTLANAVKKTGESSQTVQGDLVVVGEITGGKVTVPTPVNDSDAATKKYVDDADALDAKLAGATFTGVLNASGQRAYSPGNTTDVATIGTLDNYTPMVRTTGNQTIGGAKKFTTGIEISRASIAFGARLRRSDVTAGQETSNKGITYIEWVDSADNQLGLLNVTLLPNGTTRMTISVRNSDGTTKELTLLSGDVI